MGDARDVDVAATRVQVEREFVELLRTVREAVQQQDRVRDRSAVMIEARSPLERERIIAGIERNVVLDRPPSVSKRSRVRLVRCTRARARDCPEK
jgi:hypothetical protein